MKTADSKAPAPQTAAPGKNTPGENTPGKNTPGMQAPYAVFAYTPPAALKSRAPEHHAHVVVGAGPAGLALAIDLAQRGLPVLLLDESDRIGEGSRAICFSKKSLEILDTYGCGEALRDTGVQWSKGRVFQHDTELYTFDLLPEAGHKMPAFINIEQFKVEKALVERAQALPNLEIRWKNRLVALTQHADHAALTIETPDGPYTLHAAQVLACDGARSSLRTLLGLDSGGEIFEEQFLIADVHMHGDFPAERWFWFDPPFHPGGSALLHKQPGNLWRIDLQLPATADAEAEKRPENVRPRLERMLGHTQFDLAWVSVYRFRCLRLERFIHNCVIFAGDSAHQVSPFGARGANSGLQDVENLGWKLAALAQGRAGPGLLASYDTERSEGADDNLGHSTRSTDFIAPQGPAERVLRDAALVLARHHDFAKRMVNSGRLSLPTAYTRSPLSTPDSAAWAGGPAPGAPLPDARLTRADGSQTYLSEARGTGFCLLIAGVAPPVPPGMHVLEIAPSGTARSPAPSSYNDSHGDLAARFALNPGSAYLLRPDGHIAARWPAIDPQNTADAGKIAAAYARALGFTDSENAFNLKGLEGSEIGNSASEIAAKGPHPKGPRPKGPRP